MLSQKVYDIGGRPFADRADCRRTANRNKPMAIVHHHKDDHDVTGNDEWDRLEIRFADAGLSHYGRVLSLGVSSMVLRLLEFEDIADVQCHGFQNSLLVAHQASRDLSFKQTYPTVEGKKMTAADFQESIAESFLALDERIEMPKSEVRCAEMLLEVTDAIRRCNAKQGDYKAVAGLGDAYTKLYMLSKSDITRSDMSTANGQAYARDIKWHDINPATSLGLKIWERQHAGSPVLPPKLEQRLVTHPPQHTRANIRGPIVAANTAHSVSWVGAELHNGGVVDLSDPYAHTRTPEMYYK